MLSLEGKQLGNYEVIRRIRVGGMGAVYEGIQRTAFDRRVAIKVILGDYAKDRDMRRRFAREARTIARLHHPHILQLIEFGDEQGILFLVMPFIDGGTLTSYLRRNLPDLGEIASMYQQLLDAVEHAHEAGLIHRDIKSSNVLLELRRNAAPYVYLGDFGLVRTMRPGAPSQEGKPIPLDQVPGTPHYMAPEQTRGIVTPLTDIYALGVLLYQMLTGELPYNDDDEVRVIQMHMHAPIPSPCEHDVSIPPELDTVVRTAMAKRPEDRYQNVAELRDAFLAAIDDSIPDEPEDIREIKPAAPRQTRHLTSQLQPRHTYPLRPLDLPEPIVIQSHNDEDNIPTLVREVQEWQERPRVTEAAHMRQRDPRPRVTEEPQFVRRKQRPRPQPQQNQSPRLLIVMISLVVILLLLLLIVPRVLGLSIIPASIPVLGTPAIATINVHVQTQTLQDKYLLTADQQVSAPDITTHRLPERIIDTALAHTATVAATGSMTMGGVPASGFVVISNNSNKEVTVSGGAVLRSASGIIAVVVPGFTVPAHDHITEAATISGDGVKGDIAAHTLDGPCCNNGALFVTNAAFSGGVDGKLVHLVQQSDIDNAQNAQVANLKQQIIQQVQKQLGPDDILAGQPDYKTQVSTSLPANSQADHFDLTVKVAGSAITYNRASAEQLAVDLLNKEAGIKLDKAYRPQASANAIGTPIVTQVKDNLIYLNVSARGSWTYTFTPAQIDHILQNIKGSSSDAAQAYLKDQTGIASADIHLPFGTSQLPTNPDNIKFTLGS